MPDFLKIIIVFCFATPLGYFLISHVVDSALANFTKRLETRKVVANKLGIKPYKVRMNRRLQKKYNVSWIDMSDIISAIQDIFGVEIEPELVNQASYPFLSPVKIIRYARRAL